MTYEVTMKILAIDSTAGVASVAVCEGERLLGSFNVNNGLTQSELLLPMVEALLRTLKLSFSDIELLAATVGPGSFTGVRIGAALIKGLAFGRDIPCVGVSTLEALAENLAPLTGVYAPAMDARRAQVYNALFRYEGGELKRLTEDRAIAASELAAELAELSEPVYISGDGYGVLRAAMAAAGLTPSEAPPELIPSSAYSVARVAKRKYDAGEYTTDLALSPTYLRLPQAERERLERLAAENKA